MQLLLVKAMEKTLFHLKRKNDFVSAQEINSHINLGLSLNATTPFVLPVFSVKTSVPYSFGNMSGLYCFFAFKIGNRPRNS